MIGKKLIAIRCHRLECRILRYFGNTLLLVPLIAGIILSMASAVALAQTPPGITVNPSSGIPGSIVTITGSNFRPQLLLAITMQSSVVVSNVLVAGNGTFSVSVVVPKLPPGNITVNATDGQTSFATAPFTILNPQVNANPSSGLTSATFTITGSGFPPQLPVSIIMDGNVIAGVNTDTKGTFSTPAIVPKLLPGNFTINATVGQISALAQFNVLAPPTGVAPPANIPPPDVPPQTPASPPSQAPSKPGVPPARVDVKLPVSWQWILPVLLIIVGMTFGIAVSLRRINYQNRLERFIVESHEDSGIQEIDIPARMDLAIRFKVISDSGEQKVEGGDTHG